MPPRVESEKLNVKNMRQPCQGMPVASVAAGKSPGNRMYGQSIPDVRILSYVLGIVVTGELKIFDRPIKGDCDQGQKKTNTENQRSAIQSHA
jgi:hypothetical protein